MQDSTMKFEVEIPRSQVVTARKLANGAPVKQAVERAVATFTGGWEAGVSLSKDCIRQISSLLNVQTFNSEESLIDAIEKRFETSASTVIFEVDHSLANIIKQKAKGTDVPFNEYVRRFVHSMFRYGILDWGLKTVFFQENEWKRAKAALGTVPSTGENFAKIIEEWKQLKANAAAAAELPPAPPVSSMTQKPELTASERNIQQALADDVRKKALQRQAAAGLDKHSPEYRQKLAESMNRMTAQPGPHPLAEPQKDTSEVEAEAGEAELEPVKVETDETGQATDVEVPNF